MEDSLGVGIGLKNESPADSHSPDKLLSLLSTTSMYICNIETSNDADALLKDALNRDFKTINDLLTDAVTGRVSIDEAKRLQLSDSPIRSAEGYKEMLISIQIVFTLYG